MNNIKQAADQLILKYKTILVEEIETSQKILDNTALKCAQSQIITQLEEAGNLIRQCDLESVLNELKSRQNA